MSNVITFRAKREVEKLTEAANTLEGLFYLHGLDFIGFSAIVQRLNRGRPRRNDATRLASIFARSHARFWRQFAGLDHNAPEAQEILRRFCNQLEVQGGIMQDVLAELRRRAEAG